MPRATLAPLAPLAAVLLLSGCGGDSSFDQPKAEAFHVGPCRAVAASILRTGRLAHDLGSSTAPSEKVRTDLKAAQDQLIAVRPALTPDLSQPLGDLIVSIGLVRLRADTGSYAVSVTEALSAAYQTAVKACTG